MTTHTVEGKRTELPPTPAEILRAARAKIDSPEKLARGICAADKDGDEVDLYSRKAVRFCVFGSVRRVCRDLDGSFEPAWSFLRKAAEGTPHVPITLNDSCGHPEILEFMDRAILLAQQNEGGES